MLKVMNRMRPILLTIILVLLESNLYGTCTRLIDDLKRVQESYKITKNLSKENTLILKKTFDELEDVVLEQEEKDDLSKLADILLSLLEGCKDKDLFNPYSNPDRDPDLLRPLMKKDDNWLHAKIINTLTKFISHVDGLYQKLSSCLRFFLNKSYHEIGDKETYIKAIISLSKKGTSNDQQKVFEWFLTQLAEGKQQWDGLMDSFLEENDANYPQMFEFLIRILDQRSHDRKWQKNTVYMMVKLFDRISDHGEAKDNLAQGIFNKLIKPLKDHKNLYIRESLSEFLERIEGLKTDRIALLLELKKDKESEVQRFAKIALSKINREQEGEQPKEGESEKNFEGSIVKTGKKSKKDSIVLPYQEEFAFFKRLLTDPSNKKNNNLLIRNLNSHNPLISRYAWDIFYKRYYKQGSFEQKKHWICLLGKALNEPSLNLVNCVSDHIEEFVKEPEFVEKAASGILSSLRNGITSRELINLFYHIVSKKAPSEIIDSFLVIFEASIAPESKLDKELKQYLLSTVTLLNLSSKQQNRLVSILVRIFNNKFDERCLFIAGEHLCEIIRHKNKLKDISKELIIELGKIDINSKRQDTIAYILQFMLFIISQDGGGSLGTEAATFLCSVLERSKDFSHAILIDEGLTSYNLSELAVIAELKKCVCSYFHSHQYGPAWSEYLGKNYESSLSAIDSRLEQEEKKEEEGLGLGVLYYIKALNQLALGSIDEACLSLAECEEMSYNESFTDFLSGEIKFYQNNFGEAVDFYKKVATGYPFYLKGLLRLNETYYNLGDYYAEQECLKTIQRLNPRYDPPHRLSQKIEESFYPFKTEIKDLEENLEDFIKVSLEKLSKIEQGQDEDLVRGSIKTDFLELKNEVEKVFGEKINQSILIKEISWDDLLKYPKEFVKHMRSILEEIITQKIPNEYHANYQCIKDRFSYMTNLECQVVDAFKDAFPEITLQFLQSHAGRVLTAYEFVNEFALKNTVRGGYALGLSKDASEAYNTLINLLGLEHWDVSYYKLNVEPDGNYTAVYLTKMMEENKPIVFFVPILTKDGGVTKNEVLFFINKMKELGKVENLILVFGAYDIFPLYISKKEAGKKCLSKKYLADILRDESRCYDRMLSDFFQNILITRIKINLIDNVPDKEEIPKDDHYNENNVYLIIFFLGKKHSALF